MSLVDNTAKQRFMARMTEFKDKANELHKQGKFQDAITLYDVGIRQIEQEYGKTPQDYSVIELLATLFSNRSASYIALDDLEAALMSVVSADFLRPMWRRPHIRLAQAFYQRNRIYAAIDILERCLGTDSEVSSILKQYNSNTVRDQQVTSPIGRLFIAIKSNLLDTVIEIISSDPSLVNARIEMVGGRTPLMLACLYGSDEMVKYLLDQGAVVGAIDKFRETALYCAVVKDRLSVCKLLFSKGAKIDQRTRFGLPIFLAIQGNCVEIVRFFIEHVVDINVIDRVPQRAHFKCTMLGAATMLGNLELVQLLIDHKADVNQLCTFFETVSIPPLSAVCQLDESPESMKILLLLLRSGAKVHNPQGLPIGAAFGTQKLKFLHCMLFFLDEKEVLSYQKLPVIYETWSMVQQAKLFDIDAFAQLPKFDILDKEKVIVIEPRIGKGGQGEVHKIELHDVFLEPRLFARKTVLNGDQAHKEIDLLRLFRHENIMTSRLSAFAADKAFIFMDLMDMSLSDFLTGFRVKQRNIQTVEDCMPYLLRSIVNGIKYLHVEFNQGPIVHLDLKPHNVLIGLKLDQQSGVEKVARVLLSDFGSTQAAVRSRTATTSKMVSQVVLHSFHYSAPEVKAFLSLGSSSIDVSTSADNYSFGIILGECMTRRVHRHQDVTINLGKCGTHEIKYHAIPFSNEELASQGLASPVLVQLYRRCISSDPKSRPKIQEIIDMLNRADAFDFVDPSDADLASKLGTYAPAGPVLPSPLPIEPVAPLVPPKTEADVENKSLTNVESMSVAQVAEWLRKEDPDFAVYAEKFANARIKGTSLLAILGLQYKEADDLLIRIGVDVDGDRLSILYAIRKLAGKA